jgi:hypothetical protein
VADDDVTGSEETDEATGEETDETADGGAGEEGEYKPPSKEEWLKVRAALKKRNEENKRLREKSQAADETTESEVAKALREAQEKADRRVITSEAKAALATAKAKSGRISALLRVADVSSLKLDDDGEVEGLAEWVDEQKTAYPEFFDARTLGKGNVGAGDKKAPEKKLSYAEQLIQNART